MTAVTHRPAATEHAPYYSRYIDLVPEADIVSAMEKQIGVSTALLAGVSEGQWGYRYEPGKWSIREVVGHVTDAERVFAFRALAFARADASSLPGFEEGEYVANSGFEAVALTSLVDAWNATRNSTIHLLRTLPAGAWDRSGVANGDRISVRALAYAILGHERHHMSVLRSRYLAQGE